MAEQRIEHRLSQLTSCHLKNALPVGIARATQWSALHTNKILQVFSLRAVSASLCAPLPKSRRISVLGTSEWLQRYPYELSLTFRA